MTGRNDPPATTELAKLRSEIRRCETFLALCSRIKELERLHETNALSVAVEKLETQRAQFLAQLEQSRQALEQDEALLRAGGHPEGTVLALNERIKSGRVRSSSLELNAEEAAKQIELTRIQVQTNTSLLKDLYEELEKHMQQGFHPNTVAERLSSLRELNSQLKETVRADFPLKSDKQKSGSQSIPKDRAPNAVPLGESDFYAFLLEDLAAAKKSVEIRSPLVAFDRAMQILTVLEPLVADGCNVTLRTRPAHEHDEPMKQDAMQVIADAHRLRITVIQQGELQKNAVFIDGHTCWEGNVNILGPFEEGKTMRRLVGGSNVRELRHFLANS